MTDSLIGKRLTALRAVMARRGLAGWTIRTSDPYLSEYVPERWTGVKWLTGFTGSTAVFAVTADAAALFTDGRYWEQAERQLQGTEIRLVRAGAPGEPDVTEWLADHLPVETLVGTDYESTSISLLRHMKASLAKRSLRIRHEEDLLDIIWTKDRPAQPDGPVYALKGAGKSVAEKLADVRRALAASESDALYLTSLDETAWLTNCRGSDIHCNPVFLSTMLVTDERAVLFCRPERFEAGVIEALAAEGVEVRPPHDRAGLLAETFRTKRVLIDPDRTPAALLELIRPDSTEGVSPVTHLKSRKSDAELASIREAMKEDGKALCEFYAELDERLENGEVLTELDVAACLHSHRAAGENFLDESFDTIAAFGPNGALPHYLPTEEHHAVLTNGLLLIDSGGQYRTGTTDITRMTAVGTITDDMRRDVTTVLKGMIGLARTSVPAGTSGAQLDVAARAPLWREGLDYGHGTGHGVGFVLNVHEGPFSISPRSVKTGEMGLQAGLVLSDEPGVYRPGRWGVRIENLVTAKVARETEFGTFLDFEVLTLCPIDVRTLDVSLLDNTEKNWLNAYHDRVREVLFPHLSQRAKNWFEKAAKPI